MQLGVMLRCTCIVKLTLSKIVYRLDPMWWSLLLLYTFTNHSLTWLFPLPVMPYSETAQLHSHLHIIQACLNDYKFNLSVTHQILIISNTLCLHVCLHRLSFEQFHTGAPSDEARLVSRLLGFIRRGLFKFIPRHCPEETLHLYTSCTHVHFLLDCYCLTFL